MTQIIRVSSAEIQAVFTTWLATQIGVGVRLVILEGLSGVGKSWLTREPFISDGWVAETIEVDHFRKDPVGSKSYVSAIDRAALEAAIDAALVSLLAIVIVCEARRPRQPLINDTRRVDSVGSGSHAIINSDLG